MGGGFPLDLILFGMIAAFLVLRLRSVLGRRTGFERPTQDPRAAQGRGPVAVPGMGRAAPPTIDVQPAAPARPLPDPNGPVGTTLQRMRGVDRAFDPTHFLGGAEGAFRLIVEAFARGDRVALRPLLTDGTYRAFETAIAAREEAGHTQRSELKGIEAATIEEAVLDGSMARIGVRFVSDQVSETLDAGGRHVSGTEATTEITDHWMFERDLRSPDPAWRLAAARSG